MSAYVIVKCSDCGFEWEETEERMNIVITHPLSCSRCGCEKVDEL
jgi:predicted Zn-ribbon and HTH transcriptional regulator